MLGVIERCASNAAQSRRLERRGQIALRARALPPSLLRPITPTGHRSLIAVCSRACAPPAARRRNAGTTRSFKRQWAASHLGLDCLISARADATLTISHLIVRPAWPLLACRVRATPAGSGSRGIGDQRERPPPSPIVLSVRLARRHHWEHAEVLITQTLVRVYDG